MKKLLPLLLCTCFLLGSPFLFGAPGKKPDESKFVQCEKTYILPEQIFVADDGLYIFLQGNWHQTDRIQRDSQGLFFNTIESPENVMWICPVCGKENHHYKKICSQCGAQRPYQLL